MESDVGMKTSESTIKNAIYTIIEECHIGKFEPSVHNINEYDFSYVVGFVTPIFEDYLVGYKCLQLSMVLKSITLIQNIFQYLHGPFQSSRSVFRYESRVPPVVVLTTLLNSIHTYGNFLNEDDVGWVPLKNKVNAYYDHAHQRLIMAAGNHTRQLLIEHRDRFEIDIFKIDAQGYNVFVKLCLDFNCHCDIEVTMLEQLFQIYTSENCLDHVIRNEYTVFTFLLQRFPRYVDATHWLFFVRRFLLLAKTNEANEEKTFNIEGQYFRLWREQLIFQNTIELSSYFTTQYDVISNMSYDEEKDDRCRTVLDPSLLESLYIYRNNIIRNKSIATQVHTELVTTIQDIQDMRKGICEERQSVLLSCGLISDLISICTSFLQIHNF